MQTLIWRALKVVMIEMLQMGNFAIEDISLIEKLAYPMDVQNEKFGANVDEHYPSIKENVTFWLVQ